jgi:hypothetical protein
VGLGMQKYEFVGVYKRKRQNLGFCLFQELWIINILDFVSMQG